MTGALDTTPSTIDRIRHDLVGLKMPRALEALDHVVRRLEKGEIAALEAIDILLSEELTLRENSRIELRPANVAPSTVRHHQFDPARRGRVEIMQTGIAHRTASTMNITTSEAIERADL